MAPRRGGGGSWGGGGSVSCNGNAFSDESSKILISFAALFFVIYLILSFFVPGKKKRMAINGGQPLGSNGRWTALSWAISLQLIALILYIAAVAMQQCGSTFNAYMPVFTAQNWIGSAGLLCLWGVILVPVCKALHKVGGSLVPKLVAATHSVYIGWLTLLMVTWLSIYTAAQHMQVTSGSSYNTREQLAKAANGLYVTVDVFAVIGMLMAAASMIMALSRSAQLSGALKLWVYTLSFAAVAHAVIDLAIFVRLTYEGRTVTMDEAMDANLATIFLIRFFFGLMFLSAVFILKNPQVLPDAGAAPAATAYPPVPHPVDQQQEQGQQQFPQQPPPPMAYNNAPGYGYNQQTYPSPPPPQPYYQQ